MIDTKDIRPERLYEGVGGTKRLVLKVFGRGRNRQVRFRTVAGVTEVPGGGGYDPIKVFAHLLPAPKAP